MASKLKKPQEPSEGDLVAARAAVKFAELQRKVASWLPPRTEEERAREAAQEDEDEEEFEVGYELYVCLFTFCCHEFVYDIAVIPVLLH